MQKQEVAPFISLPDSWEAYLDLLPRIERKELRRKLRRLETVPHSFEIADAGNEFIFNEFIRLHRLSDRSKEQFMGPAMERFFRGLAFSVEGAWKRGFAVLSISGKPAGIIFYFEHEKHALLYNSGFDPEQRYYSSGLMTHALLIRRNIEKGIKVHDFLRGSERYKYDLGAKDINLYKISINL
jgi:CelD/BcsL family acetyltransferase involved in cellulose biosynthesis